MSAESYSVLKALAYFDIFHYPLSLEEIACYMDRRVSRQALIQTLEELVQSSVIYKLGEWYAVGNTPALYCSRVQRNMHAEKMMKTAMRIGKLLQHFPFVRAVCISGSLSKQCAERDSDIDLFIITAENRLWLARTLLHLVKKVSFLFNRQGWFCMNYFVSGKSLRIQERNLYTATELVTLIPVQENRYFANFIRANLWAYVYFPNLPVKIGVEYGERPKSFVKYWIEKGFANAAGNILDDYCWRITQKRWLRKEQQKEVNSKGFPMSLIAEKQLAKPSPAYFQQKVLNAYLNRVGYLDTRFYQVSAC